MAAIVKMYLHQNRDIGHTMGLNLIQRSDEDPLEFTSLESATIGLTLLKGDSADVLETFQIGGTPALAFVIKRVGAQTGEALAICESFAWSGTENAYVGSITMRTLQMRAVFAGKVDALDQSGLNYTFVAADATRLVARSHTTNLNAKIPKQADVAWANGATIAVLNNSTYNLTVTGDTGVTFTSLTIAPGDLYILTRTGTDTWNAAEAEELDSLSARGQWAYRDTDLTTAWTYGPDFAVKISDPYYRGSEAIPENTANPTAYVTDSELTAEVASQIGTQFGTPQGAVLPDTSGAGLRGDVINVDIVGFFVGGAPMADVTQTYDGNDLQRDLVTLDAGSTAVAAVYELRLEGSRYHTGGAGENGGYINAITIDGTEAFYVQRSGDAAFTDRRVAYTFTATVYVSKVGTTGKAHCMWALRETDGTTVRDFSSRSTAAASGDDSAFTFDTTAAHDLGIAARYLTTDGAGDHSIPRAILRRIL